MKQLVTIPIWPFLASLAVFACSLAAFGEPTSARPPQWVTAKPGRETQIQTSAEERGTNPCAPEEDGFGVYGEWRRDVKFGQYLLPPRGGLRHDGSFDVMFHFHGHEAARKSWVKVMTHAVFASVDLGIGSGSYEQAFQSPLAFSEYLESVEAAVAKATGKPNAHARNIGLSAWSAGYGAIQRILAQPIGKRIDTVILLDGLHSGYVDGVVNGLQISSVVDFAASAAKGSKLFFVSHSSIIPEGYASTTETAHFLVWKVHGTPRASRSAKPGTMGLRRISYYDRRGFHERGYVGNDKMDHCAHLGLYKNVLNDFVLPRWRTPKVRVK